MAVGDIKYFTINQGGLVLTVEAIELVSGETTFNIKCTSGSGDLNAIWWGDGDASAEGNTTLSKADNALGMNGSGVTWDGYQKLSSAGLGTAGTAKDTFITANETLSFTSHVSLDDITALGIRATSVNGSGSIKGFDTGADQTFKLPTMSIGNAPVTEGGNAQFTITLSNTYPYDIKVKYSTTEGTAHDGPDYDGQTDVWVTIPANTPTYTFSVETNDDFYAEGIETFSVTLSGAKVDAFNIPVTLTDAVGEATITDDFDITTILLSAPSAVDEGGQITVTASVDHPPQGDLTITLSNGKIITILDGATSGNVTFDAPAEDVYNDAGPMTLGISTAVGGNYEALATSSTVTVQVNDTIDTTTISLSAPSGVDEGGQITVTASVDHPPQGDLTITLSNGKIITILDGETSGNVTFDAPAEDVYNDAGPEVFGISSAVGGNYEAVDATSVVTVQVNDTIDTTTVLLSAPSAVDEGGQVTVTANIDNAPQTDLTITLSNGETITILAGESTGSVSFSAPDNSTFGPNPPLAIAISGTTGGNFEDLDTSSALSIAVIDNEEDPGGGQNPNSAPVANNDHWVVSNATQFTIPVEWFTHNDTDAEGPVYVTNVVVPSSNWTANYDSAGHLTSVTVSSSGPVGAFSLTYEVTDSGGAKSTATVSVDVVQTQGNNGTDTINLAAYTPYDHSFIDLKNGDDVGIGSTGIDTFVGGQGKDTLSGGANNDVFRYEATNHSFVTYKGNGSVNADSRDTINGFTSGSDKLDFSGIVSGNGDLVTSIDTNLADGLAAHSVGWVSSGGNTTVYVNASDAVESIAAGQSYTADMEINLTGVNSLTASDIIL